MYCITSLHNITYISTILLLITSLNSLPITFITSSTHCNITFNPSSTTSNESLTILSCIQTSCYKYLIGGHCANLQLFQLQPQNCLKQCCGSYQFDSIKCQQYNNKKSLIHQSQDSKLILILLSCLLILLISLTTYLIYILQCCTSPPQNPSKKSIEYLYHWKSCKFTLNKSCVICKQNGAFIMNYYQFFFHLKCINSTQIFSSSQYQFNRYVKVFCPICLNKYIVVAVSNRNQVKEKIKQIYQFHPSKCFQSMNDELDTERKLTESTKQ